MFWAVRIPLARELQAQDQMVKEIREATVAIKRGQQTSLDGVRTLEDVLEGYLANATKDMGDGVARPTSGPLAP